MKKFNLLLIAFTSLGFFSFCPATETDIKGVWKGSYSTTHTVTGIVVFFKKGKLAEIYSETNNSVQKIRGSYSLNPANELFVSFNMPDKEATVTMTGKLNTTRNLVSGDWQTTSNENGNFYFQKQVTENGEKIISIELVTAN